MLPVALLALGAVALAPGAASAQDAAISGAVTDTTGLVLPGVTVEARGADGEVRTGATDAGGQFTIPDCTGRPTSTSTSMSPMRPPTW